MNTNKLIFPNNIIHNKKIENNNNNDNIIKIAIKNRVTLLFGDVQSGKTEYVKQNIIIPAFKINYFKFIFYLSGNLNKLHKQNFRRIEIESKAKKYDWKILDWTRESIALHNDNSVVFIKTTSKDLNNLKTIKGNSKNILLIIDECDYAAVSEKNENLGKINEILSEIYNSRKNINFFIFSATPYRNLSSSNKNTILPNYILYKENDKDYCGLKIFHNKINDNKYVTYVKKTGTASLIDNIQSAICQYLSDTIRMKFDKIKEYKKTKLLINISTKQVDHEKHKEYVWDFLRKIRRNNGNVKEFEKYYYRYFNGKLIGLIHKKIYEITKEIIHNNYIYVSNHTNHVNDENDDHYAIIIGGNLLGRGITFKNLITTIMLNQNKTTRASTLLQRARWFGFRKDYLKYTKILLSKECNKRYIAINKINDFAKKLIIKNENNFNNGIKNKIDIEYKYILESLGINTNGAKIE